VPQRHSGFFIQSSHGNVGNFELLTPRPAGGGAAHYWRDNDAPETPWFASALAFGSPDDVNGLSLIQGSFGPAGNLEAVALEGSQLVHHWRDDGGSWRWQARTLLPGSVPAVFDVALVQSTHGSTGNYEVVAPVAAAGGGGLAHWSRQNDAFGLPWSNPTFFGVASVEAVAMVQSTLGAAGNLEVVARVGNQLVQYWRDDGASWEWHGPLSIPDTDGVTGKHAFLQSSFGNVGNFELVAPLSGGGVGHWWRDNDDGFTWHGPTVFGAGTIDALGIIQSTFGGGNLELVARVGDGLFHYWRSPDSDTWVGPFLIVDPAPPDPQAAGASSIPYNPPIVAIHAAVARTGKLAIWGNADFDASAGIEAVLDLASGVSSFPAEHHHLFCSGHASLPDGRIVIMGGHMEGVTGVHVFHPEDDYWEHVTDMLAGRWYPTCTALPSGQVLTMSGTMGSGGPVSPSAPVNNTLQLFDPETGLQPNIPLPTPFSGFFPAEFPTIDLYPFVFVLPDGGLLVHSRNVSRFYDWTSDTWSPLELPGVYAHSRTYPGQGSAVLLPLVPGPDGAYPPRVLIVGGGGADPQNLDVLTPATETVELLDLSAQVPAWRFTASLSGPRVMGDATLLPDGTVLVTGGSATGRADMGIDPVLAVELFDPTTESWSILAPMKTPRSYHSMAILLPSAQVLVGGKDFLFNLPPYDYPEHRLEVISPPYLFRGPRPVLGDVPTTVAYGESFTVTTPDAPSIASAVLMRPGSITHSFNMEQRSVGLVLVGQTGGELTLQAPPGASITPPGYYMLFVLNGAGVPSHAQFIQVK
jgi:hypothetical protein